jgi:flagellar protein FlbD
MNWVCRGKLIVPTKRHKNIIKNRESIHMVKVTKLNRKDEFYINPSMIETIEKTPDTVITLINGKKYVVADSLDEVLQVIENYYKIVGLTSPQIIFNSYDFDAE